MNEKRTVRKTGTGRRENRELTSPNGPYAATERSENALEPVGTATVGPTERQQRNARALLERRIDSACTLIRALSGHGVGKEPTDVAAFTRALEEQIRAVHDGSLRGAEAILVAQAHTLDALFNSLARCALSAESTVSRDAHLRLALKAQAQCRTTLETVADIRYPSVVFARQANIAHGHQQVNNGVPTNAQSFARAEESANGQNKLLEQTYGQGMDSGA